MAYLSAFLKIKICLQLYCCFVATLPNFIFSRFETLYEILWLFNVDRTRISRHISNIYKDGELDKTSTCAETAHMGNLGIQNYTKKLYNLDMILAVGYRVKSPNGIVFRKWATSILKDYMIKGYAINEKRLKALNRVIEIQSRIIAQNYNIDEKAVLRSSMC